MSPRAYTLGQRQAGLEATRARIIATAGDVLASGVAPGGFSLEAVARAAGVARMTVYNQFGSRAGLLEAVFDARASQTSLADLRLAFSEPDPLAGLDSFIAIFVGFWAADPDGHRRLRALGVLDSELGVALRARDERRRQGLEVILGRLRDRHGRPIAEPHEDAVDVLSALTGFATFDALITPGRDTEAAMALIRRAARAILELPGV